MIIQVTDMMNPIGKEKGRSRSENSFCYLYDFLPWPWNCQKLRRTWNLGIKKPEREIYNRCRKKYYPIKRPGSLTIWIGFDRFIICQMLFYTCILRVGFQVQTSKDAYARNQVVSVSSQCTWLGCRSETSFIEKNKTKIRLSWTLHKTEVFFNSDGNMVQ